MLKKWRLSLYTFGAVFLAIFLVGLVVVPTVLNFAQRIYFILQADVNQRQAESMSRFVENRLQRGIEKKEVIREFQATIEGMQTDRGYVCLIDQPDVTYLCHPDLQVRGMDVKPMATFDRDFSGDGGIPWHTLIRQGVTARGILDVGPNMPKEIIYFTSVPGTKWTISSHENTARVNAEISELRSTLTAGAILLGLLFAIPASAAARQVSRRHERHIEKENELERRVLEAENARKTLELEQARKVQLSMLPESLPKHPLVDLSAHMQTASEVGGDYYDYHLSSNGVLTLAIGDATGHGMQAGMMVTAMKSLFTHLAQEGDMIKVLQHSTRALKRMKFPNLYMAFALCRLRNGSLELVGAGMPPALVYRADDEVVEEITLSGAPLGWLTDFPYEKRNIELAPGDTVVLMSDGFPELFNEAGEMFGYDRAVTVLEEVASQTPDEIIRHFKDTASNWANGRSPDDDETFVVLKVKGAV